MKALNNSTVVKKESEGCKLLKTIQPFEDIKITKYCYLPIHKVVEVIKHYNYDGGFDTYVIDKYLDQAFTKIRWNRFNKIEKQKTKVFEKDHKNDLVLCWTLTWLEYAFNY